MKPIEIPGLVTQGTWASWAITSPDDSRRYVLARNWDPEPTDPWDAVRPPLLVTMLNPSKARHDVDDMTITKLIHFGKQEGCGGILVRNLSAFSATSPDELGRNLGALVDEQNLAVLKMSTFGLKVAAWGNFPSQRVRAALVSAMSIVKCSAPGVLHVFGLTKSGEPLHPCRLPHATRLRLWHKETA